ncbi:hypothetical protein CH63R_01893 [Colletotrichum higginsianum IMI 349063]|uniref:Uncharacterized protein n=1 Tax=Colletotrichum higginsianum (strain IMI 349063) TaxID=759273 RepID=A0A1B7YM97_COLHI|nr:hypothetical protein CH63R_01893 [Colletotrichum higginsianum IMI 349063]OBR13167.1 hypothetical protein CH63R_01893 [Colletotrichum higginsianum IMI 349063]
MTVCLVSGKYAKTPVLPKGEAIDLKLILRGVRLEQTVKFLDIIASSSQSRREPEYAWNDSAGSYDTGAVRKQLGATLTTPVQDTDERQIMSIGPESLRSSLAEAMSKDAPVKYYSSDSWIDEYSRPPPRHITFCPYCDSPQDGYSVTDPIYTQLLTETLNQTESPARALQAVYFTHARAVYYDYIQMFSPVGTASITSFETTLVPSTHWGYFSVMGALGLFMVTFGLVASLFRSTRYSLPENAWHTVAQISESPELSELLCEVKSASDDAVESIIYGTTSPAGLSGHLKRLYKTFKTPSSPLSSLIGPRSRDKVSQFVVRDGVFVRVVGAETNSRQELSELRHRPATTELAPQYSQG